MSRPPFRWSAALLLMLALGLPARAQAGSRGIFLGDEHRYGGRAVFPHLVARTASDLIALPSGVMGWNGGQWALGLSVVASTVLLSVPFPGGSLDVRARNAIQASLGPQHWRLLTRNRDYFIYGGLAVGTLGLLSYGLAAHSSTFVEVPVLITEAVGVAQVFHLALKLLTGRQGPYDGEGLGLYEGPRGCFKYFPAGTPSGHVATVFAVFSVLMKYFGNPVLTAVLGSVGLAFATFIVIDDYHYLSEVLIGGILGAGAGEWVVRNRSSRYREVPGGSPERIPGEVASRGAALQASPLGLSVSFPF